MRITIDFYDRKFNQYKQRQEEIGLQLEEHTQGDKDYYVASSTVAELASKAFELFMRSEVAEKRQLLSFILQNSQLDGKKLNLHLKQPFDAVLQCAKSQSWLRGADSNRQPNG